MEDDITKIKAQWPAQRRAPANAPNVLVFLTDDVGYGACSTFGGPIPTPVLDQLAAQGLRYTQFHTTAMCSPTRAALLTGRNPHNVNMGRIANQPSGVDGYTATIPKTAGTVAEVLRRNGYNTAMFGKSHLAPEWETSSAGPFDRWPTGLGFEYFYGFLEHDTNMWAPSLVENTTFIEPPASAEPKHFDELLADRAIGWIKQQRATAPDQPFFAYYATGTAHTPHHAPQQWLEKFRGCFDMGWDEMRKLTFERQKSLGVIPADAQLTQRFAELPAWDSLSGEQQVLAARFMEAYAAALAFADHQVGRVIEALREVGELDNTLIIFIQGDNGSSAEGGKNGLLFAHTTRNGFTEDLSYALGRLDDIGGPTTYNHYPAAWGWAMNAPFQYYKQVASHFGGTRNGMVMRWPAKIASAGGVRSQFHHVSDLMPTILDAVGIEAPRMIDGVPQDPLDGTSLMYTIDQPSVPSRKTVQIFECRENFGIYVDGWFACSRPEAFPWVGAALQPPVRAARDRTWELYDIRSDFSQANDLAATHPEKLAEMQQAFWEAAKANKILPMHSVRMLQEGRPTVTGDRKVFTYHGRLDIRIAECAAPHVIGHSFSIAADLTVPAAGGQGVIVSHGGRFGGYALYLHEGHLVFHYNALDPRHYQTRSAGPLRPGRHQVVARVLLDGTSPSSPAGVTLSVDGKVVAQGRIEVTLRSFTGADSFSVGRASLTTVSGDLALEDSELDGELGKVVVTVD